MSTTNLKILIYNLLQLMSVNQTFPQYHNSPLNSRHEGNRLPAIHSKKSMPDRTLDGRLCFSFARSDKKTPEVFRPGKEIVSAKISNYKGKQMMIKSPMNICFFFISVLEMLAAGGRG